MTMTLISWKKQKCVETFVDVRYHTSKVSFNNYSSSNIFVKREFLNLERLQTRLFSIKRIYREALPEGKILGNSEYFKNSSTKTVNVVNNQNHLTQVWENLKSPKHAFNTSERIVQSLK